MTRTERPGSGQVSEASKLAVYLELVARGEADWTALTRELGLSPQEDETAWSSLEALGLVRRASEKRGQIVAVPPETALLRALRRHRALSEHRIQESRRLEEVVEALIGVYLPTATTTRSAVHVSFVSSRSEMSQSFNDLLDTAQEVVSAMCAGPVPALLELRRNLNGDRHLIERGVHVRRIHPQRHTLSPDIVTNFEQSMEMGVELRLAPVVPLQMLVADTSLALLPSDPEEPEEGMAVIRGAALIRPFVAMFEHVWHSAVPYTVGMPGKAQVELTEEQTAILHMLTTGLKDEKIARSLGVSPRTVSRKIADLMQHLGVTSRFAAGVRAAQLGLVAPWRSAL